MNPNTDHTPTARTNLSVSECSIICPISPLAAMSVTTRAAARDDLKRTLGRREAIDLTDHLSVLPRRSPLPRLPSMSPPLDLPEIGEILQNVPTRTISAAMVSNGAGPSNATSPSRPASTPKHNAYYDRVDHGGQNLVSVTVVFAEETAGATARSKTKVKKVTRTKSDHVNIIDLDRLGFLRTCLAFQDLDSQYDLTLLCGPEYWFRSERHPNPSLTYLNVMLDLDNIARYKIRQKRICALDDDSDPIRPDSELMRGTRVPHLAGLSDNDCLHGTLNLKLRKQWECHEHLGEHGQPRVCYVNALGKHIGVNNWRSNVWTTAISFTSTLDTTTHLDTWPLLYSGSFFTASQDLNRSVGDNNR
ncbi:uncharacterized protein STEHIDRAFT_114797 [Stereum hirsutum FP-91666 SS1]|uniref:uncharacterized protein n=1 Tax=Stereum hirsutum (strain FP-91666) TaxID=721885 RepID=UPI000444A720|nr:uncharacterized protein STEHIDRAFT_114797 [Stereum hirsutum FP-91666 SS1]EIM82177.1 hypothetical protein STEHIDRAFT_114797 [Stereum hirsutum FP-91666 SS1]